MDMWYVCLANDTQIRIILAGAFFWRSYSHSSQAPQGLPISNCLITNKKEN